MIHCFIVAKRIVHLYFEHTDGDESHPDGRRWSSVMNLAKIISRLAGLPIVMKGVQSSAKDTRGSFERYSDRIEIYIRASNQTEVWQRFSTVKELCHALMESEAEYNADGIAVIGQLVQHKGPRIDWNGIPTEARSEKVAEWMAVELMYPFEFRKADKVRLDAQSTTISELEIYRGVPQAWIARVITDEYIAGVGQYWELVEPFPVDPLPPERSS